jgi:hypothetical protein
MTTEKREFTTLEIRGTADFLVFVFTDINNRVHLLTRWEDGGMSFSWEWGRLNDKHNFPPYTGPVDPKLEWLAECWLEYLDAVIERDPEWEDEG